MFNQAGCIGMETAQGPKDEQGEQAMVRADVRPRGHVRGRAATRTASHLVRSNCRRIFSSWLMPSVHMEVRGRLGARRACAAVRMQQQRNQRRRNAATRSSSRRGQRPALPLPPCSSPVYSSTGRATSAGGAGTSEPGFFPRSTPFFACLK